MWLILMTSNVGLHKLFYKKTCASFEPISELDITVRLG